MNIFDDSLATQTVIATTPILLAGTGELVSEQAGVMNIGLEGMMLAGAFFGYFAGAKSGSVWLGVAAGVAAGLALAIAMAALSIEARANQIISGIALTMLATGLTSYLYPALFGAATSSTVGSASYGNSITPMRTLRIPGLANIPGVGSALFNESPITYFAVIALGLVAVILYRSRWGLSLRAAGELPEAADVAGLSVRRIRWLAVLCAGALAGLGGAYLSVAQVGSFLDNMSAGRGYLALAAVIFGGWRVGGMLGGCLLFGLAESLELRLQGLASIPLEIWITLLVVSVAIGVVWLTRMRLRGTQVSPLSLACLGLLVVCLAALVILQPRLSFPGQLWLAVPYVLTLVALAGQSQRRSAPRALGLAYVRGGGDEQ